MSVVKGFIVKCCKCEKYISLEVKDVKYEIGGCSGLEFNDYWFHCPGCKGRARFLDDTHYITGGALGNLMDNVRKGRVEIDCDEFPRPYDHDID